MSEHSYYEPFHQDKAWEAMRAHRCLGNERNADAQFRGVGCSCGGAHVQCISCRVILHDGSACRL